MRQTWDALAGAGDERYVGDPTRGTVELESLFGRLGANPRGGRCVEVGCGPGRMTAALAARFDDVLAVDVSPAMIDRARAAVRAANVRFRAVSGERLDGVADGLADVLVCYLVLQHLPSGRHVAAYLHEFARVLDPAGEAFVQLPVLTGTLAARVWRVTRTLAVPLLALTQSPEHSPALRGFRVTEPELEGALRDARLRVLARDEGPDAPYRFSRDVFLRLGHA
jgi:SAM-dependent methyltransferase